MPEPTENNAAATNAENASAAHELPVSSEAAAELTSAPQAAQESPAGEASSGDGEGDADADAEGGDAQAESGEHGEEVTASGEAEAGPDGAVSEGVGPDGKKKRKRRRKRKSGQTLAGEAAPGEGGESKARRRDGSVAPLSRFFSGSNAGKRHGFAVGEVVAGRVKQVADGVITVDLFGKALALADEFEPREVPLIVVADEPADKSAPSDLVDGEPVAGQAAETALADGQEAAAPQAVVADQVQASPASDQTAAESNAVDVGAPSDSAGPSGEEAAPAAHEVSSDDAVASEAALQAAHDAALSDQHDEADEHDEHEGHEGQEGRDGHDAGRGPMTVLPVVPEALGRPEPPALGSVFRGRVGLTSESGHIALVNRAVDRGPVIAELEQARVQRRRVEGVVFGFNRGGFDVLVAGMRAFCPASAMSLGDIEDPHAIVGKKLEFLLPAAQPVGNDIIVSRRSILERQQRKAAREMLKGLTPGQKFKGVVSAVREFGLIVDIGGIEGLVHQSELSWAHGVRPQDAAKPGDEVEVQVLRIGAEGGRGEAPGRRDRMTRVGLSIKALLPDPWDAHQDVLREGCVQKGTVTRTTDFGAFIQLAPEIEGLLHITELGRDLKHASQAIAEGDEVHVVVERVDRRARRIALSRLTASEVAEVEAGALEDGVRAVRPGARVTVKVERVEQRGLLVRVQGAVGRRARGYVPRSEMGEAGAGDFRKSFPQGSTLEVKIVGIDRDGGLRCSPKALAVDDERKAIKDYRREAAQQGFGTFGDLLRAKLGEAGPKQ